MALRAHEVGVFVVVVTLLAAGCGASKETKESTARKYVAALTAPEVRAARQSLRVTARTSREAGNLMGSVVDATGSHSSLADLQMAQGALQGAIELQRATLESMRAYSQAVRKSLLPTLNEAEGRALKAAIVGAMGEAASAQEKDEIEKTALEEINFGSDEANGKRIQLLAGKDLLAEAHLDQP
jgi:hypothetical protein